MSQAALKWIVGRDTGMSSQAIWAHMMGAPCDGSYPYDPDDFSRCDHLLRLIPEWRPRILEMAKYGPVWARLAEAWDELEAMYVEKCGTGWPPPRVKCPEMYERMKELEAGLQKAAP